MKKRKQTYDFKVLLLMLMPFLSFADPFDDGIEPPPTAPIDTSTIYLAVLGVVFAAYYFYTTNLKSQKNETKNM
jgi:hypothetical protein